VVADAAGLKSVPPFPARSVRSAPSAAFPSISRGRATLGGDPGPEVKGFLNACSGVARLIFLALLLANVRGIWLSASFEPAESHPPPVKFNENWRDKLLDQWPAAIWPWGQYVFYVLAALELGALVWALLH
jgi:hypothetical protein